MRPSSVACVDRPAHTSRRRSRSEAGRGSPKALAPVRPSQDTMYGMPRALSPAKARQKSSWRNGGRQRESRGPHTPWYGGSM